MRRIEIGTKETLGIMAAVLGVGVLVWFATMGDDKGGRARYAEAREDDDDDEGGGFWDDDDDGADAAIRKMGRLADKLCVCKDMACMEGVMKEMSSMREPSGKPTKAQMEKAMKIAERMAECQKTIMTADQPPEPPTQRLDDDEYYFGTDAGL